jgi:methionyl-tRNA formyltransferase
VEPTDTAGTLHDKLMELGAQLVTETVEGLVQKNVELRVQRSFIQGSELLKPAPKLTRELQHIDWRDSTRHVYNLIRGLSPYPGAYTELCRSGQSEESPLQLKVYFGEMRHDLPKAEPGTVLSDGKTYFAVATEDGAIAITDLQLSGKKRMDVKSFLLGFRDPASYTTTVGTSRAEVAKAAPREDE